MALLLDVHKLRTHYDIQLYTDAREWNAVSPRYNEITSWLIAEQIPYRRSKSFHFGWIIDSTQDVLRLKLTYG